MPPHQHRADVFSADPPGKVIVRHGGASYLLPGWLAGTLVPAMDMKTFLEGAELATRDAGLFMSKWVRVR